MKKEEFEEKLKRLNIERFTWISLSEIDSIHLKNKSIFPDINHIRFLITDNEILIKYCDSERYGALFNPMFKYAIGQMSVSFPPYQILQEKEKFRFPKIGDIFVITDRCNKIVSQSVITKIIPASNEYMIFLNSPFHVDFKQPFKMSFYDPEKYKSDLCIHGLYNAGEYIRYSDSIRNKKKSEYGLYTEKIKIKKILDFKEV